MVASTRAYSRSGSSEQASNNRCQTSAFTQSRKRLKTLFQCPNRGGRSRHGLPVRTIHSTASTNRRLSLPLRPGSPGLPRHSGSIFAHWVSVKTNRSIRGSKSQPSTDGNPESQQAVHRCGWGKALHCHGSEQRRGPMLAEDVRQCEVHGRVREHGGRARHVADQSSTGLGGLTRLGATSPMPYNKPF